MVTLNIVVLQNIRLSDVTISDILDSDHLPIIFYLLEHIKVRNISKPIEKLIDWKQFKNIASELISPRLEINTGIQVDKVARDFTASIASTYRLLTRNVTLSDVNTDPPGLDRLSKLKKETEKIVAGNQGSNM
jgi:hypothetical protein